MARACANQWRRHSAHQLFSRKRAQVTTTRDVRDFFQRFVVEGLKVFFPSKQKNVFVVVFETVIGKNLPFELSFEFVEAAK